MSQDDKKKKFQNILNHLDFECSKFQEKIFFYYKKNNLIVIKFFCKIIG